MITFDKRLEKARELNRKIVAGEKVGTIATADLIRQNQISIEDMKGLVALYPKFEAGKAYAIGSLLEYKNELFQVIQPHTSQADWTPDITPALFKSKTALAVIPDWKQPTGAHDAYKTGNRVTFNSKTYDSLIDANTWSPATYPAGWKEII